ncbi:TIGR00282 family metallophosphoesterase [Candidatus Cloacimonadota bacterium]
MNVLYLGDIVGKPGRNLVKKYLPDLKKEFDISVCIANGENVAQGRGITEKTANELFQSGVDVFTSGNHLWDKKESLNFIASETRIVKPLNYPEKAVGSKYYIFETAQNKKLAVVCLIGQVFLAPADSPYTTIDKILPEIAEQTPIILVDFHAEATAEKRAMGFYLDGKITVLIGSHTHIQTADEEILTNGTAYITDAGMTGPHDSVIGIDKSIILTKFTSGMPQRYDVASEGLQINGVVVSIDDDTGKATNIIRIRRKY